MSKRTVQNWVIGMSVALLTAAAPLMPAGAVDPETSDVATLSPNGPHRFFTSGFRDAAFNIFDADSGKMEGSIPAGYVPNMAIAPDNSQFYVSETYWTHGYRGERQDLVSIYDAKTLNLVKEITLPGRALAGKQQNFDVSADGSKVYVYIMHPASSVVWVDLKKQAVGGTIEVPGCALIFPWGNDGFSSLCGDGSLATVTIPASGPAKVTHTKPFFDANKDPIYEDSFVDRATGRALFLSYTGLVYPAKLGAEPSIEKPWSIQEAAGYKPAGTGVQELAWRPGGAQLAAYHKASGKLFVLMHMGNYWTHKQGGTEIWVLDTNTKKLVSRFPLQPVPTSGLANERPPFYANMGVSQDDKPLLYLLNGEGNDVVVNALTGETVRKIEAAGGDAVVVPGY
ncbi:MAG TPA: amine dehydrogenase large subunit [Magnetospirillaceae bacterium]|nr:amine dehydrogenase large subunit [Magnetospirillaceae bacterium]